MIAQWSGLKSLNLSHHQITAEGLSEIAKLQEREDLDLSYNQIGRLSNAALPLPR